MKVEKLFFTPNHHLVNENTFHLVIESFKMLTNAQQLLVDLQSTGYQQSKIIVVQPWYIVSLEQFSKEDEAIRRKAALNNVFEEILVENYDSFTYYAN